MKPLRDGLVVQIPDTHVPCHHPKAYRTLLNFIEEAQPDLVIYTGDFYDFAPVSRWVAGTAEERGVLLQREIDQGWRLLNDFRDIYSGPTVFLPGNHEDRLAKWLRTRGKGIEGIDALRLPKLLGLDELDISMPIGESEPAKAFQFAPDALAIHGAAIHSKAGYSVTKELDRFGLQMSVVMGHCHRLGAVYRKAWGGKQIWGVEGGHLMDPRKADYISYGMADWSMGFSVITVEKGVSTPHLVPMAANGSFSFERVRYAA